MRAYRLAIWILLGAALAARPARATPNFPGALEGDLALASPPACSLCHFGGITQKGTVNTPFGRAMRAHGLLAYNETALRAALDQLAQERVDSDGDGTDDIDELQAGTDPNTPAPGAGGGDAGTAPIMTDPLVPQYGCQAAPTPGRGTPSSMAFLCAALAVAGLGRLRRAESTDRCPRPRGGPRAAR